MQVTSIQRGCILIPPSIRRQLLHGWTGGIEGGDPATGRPPRPSHACLLREAGSSGNRAPAASGPYHSNSSRTASGISKWIPHAAPSGQIHGWIMDRTGGGHRRGVDSSWQRCGVYPAGP